MRHHLLSWQSNNTPGLTPSGHSNPLAISGRSFVWRQHSSSDDLQIRQRAVHIVWNSCLFQIDAQGMHCQGTLQWVDSGEAKRFICAWLLTQNQLDCLGLKPPLALKHALLWEGVCYMTLVHASTIVRHGEQVVTCNGRKSVHPDQHMHYLAEASSRPRAQSRVDQTPDTARALHTVPQPILYAFVDTMMHLDTCSKATLAHRNEMTFQGLKVNSSQVELCCQSATRVDIHWN